MKNKTWEGGFLDGLTYCVELLGTNGHECGANCILNESNMKKSILKNSKENNPEIYKELKSKL